MSLPNGRIVIRSMYEDAPNPWIKVHSDRLACTEPTAATATVFTVEPLDIQNSVIALLDDKNKRWVSRVARGGTNYVEAAKHAIDVYCRMKYHELPAQTLFAFVCDNGAYWHRDLSDGGVIKADGTSLQDKLCLFAYQSA